MKTAGPGPPASRSDKFQTCILGGGIQMQSFFIWPED